MDGARLRGSFGRAIIRLNSLRGVLIGLRASRAVEKTNCRPPPLPCFLPSIDSEKSIRVRLAFHSGSTCFPIFIRRYPHYSASYLHLHLHYHYQAQAQSSQHTTARFHFSHFYSLCSVSLSWSCELFLFFFLDLRRFTVMPNVTPLDLSLLFTRSCFYPTH